MNLIEARSELYRVIVEELDPASDVAAIKLCDAIERLIEARLQEADQRHGWSMRVDGRRF